MHMKFPQYSDVFEEADDKLDELGKNRVELAQELDVNNSTVYRYFNGETNAPYQKVREIWQILWEWEEGQTQVARELMTEDPVTVTADESRESVAHTMKENDFSQLPVTDDAEMEVLGLINEVDVMQEYNQSATVEDIGFHHVIKIEPDETRNAIEAILQEGRFAVMVVEAEQYVGIITRADLLESVPQS